MIGLLIVACEIGFWVFVLAGLFFRYIVKAKRVGLAFLIGTPLIDLVLLVATAIDLRNGATAGMFHGLAAIYIAVSVVYGHSMIRWADERFAHRFAGGPAPAPKPKHGLEHARRERILWLRHLLAWAIGCALLFAMIRFVGDPDRTEQLFAIMRVWSGVLIIDFLISFSYTIWPRKEKSAGSM